MVEEMAKGSTRSATAELGSVVKAAGRDALLVAVIFLAIFLFVGSGSAQLSAVVNQLSGMHGEANRTLQAAFLLNIALILIGWRRYSDLSKQVLVLSQAEERANTRALRDPLTGFHNRRSLSENGATMIAKTMQRGKQLAMIMLDLDHFKNVNDMHGHAVGDALLRSVAAEITAIMPTQALIARLGGDEFACIMAFDRENPDVVERIVESLVSRLAQPFDAGGVFAQISGSVGIADSGPDCSSIDALMRRADIAMYAAKRAGRNRFTWFDQSMESELRERNDLETHMRAGIPRGEFVPYFEQQIDVSTGRLSGFEVLARWNHPLRGMILPDDFIPVAEETGMIADLSLSVIRQALAAARDWDSGLLISINISPTQLKDPWLAQKLVKILVETGFPANRLEVEITETSLFENLALAQSIVGSLKNQGIRLALDDFGTGYSSLAHLRALPFDRIKIDKSFVISIVENAESAAIVSAITRLGDSLGLPVTAEGIEDAGIQERLRQLGVHKGQGWHFGKPTSLAKTRTFLAERNLIPAYRAPESDDDGASTLELDERFRAAG